MFVPYKTEKLVKVVPVAEAEIHTRNGWVLVGFIDDVQAEKINCGSQIAQQPGQHNNYQTTAFASNDMAITVRRSLAVLEFDPSNELAAKTARADELTAKVKTLEQSIVKLDKALDTAKESNDVKAAQIESWRKMYADEVAKLDEKKIIIEKMERDLGRAREHIGKKGWAEIFPPQEVK